MIGLPVAVPVEVSVTRSRAGNAMPRTRAALLAGAARVVARQGTRRTSMAEIAAEAGVSKATLYNHFRTKDAVWSALVEAEVCALDEECRSLELPAALDAAARRIATHPVVRRLAADDPGILAELLSAPRNSAGWVAAEGAVTRHLLAAGRDLAAVDVVLRWLGSHLTTAPQEDAGGAVLEAMLPGPRPTGATTTFGPTTVDLRQGT